MTTATYLIEDCRELRIWDIVEEMPSTPMIEYLDFTTIGLIAQPAVYGVGGVKQSQEYWSDQADLVVRKTFTYYDTGVVIRFEWFTHAGVVGLWKEEFKPLNVVEVAKLQKANRERTIIYLQASAVGTSAEPIVNAIFAYYKTQIELWTYSAAHELIDDIIAEPEFLLDGVTPNPIYQYLHIQTRAPSTEYPNGLTVKGGILLQLTGSITGT